MILGTGANVIHKGANASRALAFVECVALLLCLCTHSWAACVNIGFQACIDVYSNAVTERCFSGSTLPNCGGTNDGTCMTSGSLNGVCLCSSFQSGSGCPSVMAYWGSGLSSGAGYYTGNVPGTSQCGGSYGCTPTRRSCHYTIKCSTQAEADSAAASFGPEEDVPASCMSDYQKCVSMDGVWKKIASTPSECSSQCDLCGSKGQTAVANAFVTMCCHKNKAPPDSVRQCYTPVQSGPGMSESVFADRNNSYDCGALTTSDGAPIVENQALYKRFCLDGDRYEEQVDTNDVGGSSSSGAGSSSSGGISSSFETELEALGGLYGVLDTIRDTLVKRLTPATEEIRDCLYNFKLCVALDSLKIDWSNMPQDTSIFQVDTAILKYIKPMMDSSVKLDSAQLKVLKQLDSLYKKGLVNDSQLRILVGDINGNVNGVETAVRGVEHGIDSLIDSMTTYMGMVGQGLGAVGDSIGDLRGDFNGFLEGEGTLPGDTTWDGYSDVYEDGSDSIGNFYLSGLGGQLDSAINDTAFDRIFSPGGGTSGPADSARLPTIDSLQRVLDSSIVAQRSELEDTLQAAFDSLKDEFMLIDYDSLVLAPLGARVPNTNTCPDRCFTFSVSDGEGQAGSWMGSVGSITFPLCSNLPGMNFDVFILIRIIGRLLTAMFCIYIGLWFIAGRKN